MAIELRLEAITDEKLLAISQSNPGYRFERSPEGKLIVSPTSLFASGGEGELHSQVRTWAKKTKLGRAFPATGGFTLPDTAVKAADTSYFSNARLVGTESSEDAFPRVAPSVAFELMSPTDTLADSMQNVVSYLANGSDVGVLITKTAAVMILRPGADWVTFNTQFVEIGPEMPGFELDVAEIMHEQRQGV
jgi:Uma2 family endonuclease